MSFLRRTSTTRLLAVVALSVALVVGGAAIALAALGGSAAAPPPKALAQAAQDALRAPAPKGVTARVHFTNGLIDGSNLEGSDPILTGASGRLWWSQDGRVRLELQASTGADAQIVVNGPKRTWWVYYGAGNTVYRGTLPAERRPRAAHRRWRIPTIARIQREIDAARRKIDVSGAQPGTVANRPSYEVRIAPRRDGGLLGAAKLAWDAATGVPLKIGVYARGKSAPVLQLEATDIRYGPVASEAFDAAPPKGAKVVTVRAPAVARGGHHGRPAGGAAGVAAVQARLPFRLSAPAKLAGLPRREVRLIVADGRRAALVTYGEGLGGIAVIQARPGRHERSRGAGGGRHELRLPEVSIDGATGTELATALGTVITFERGGVGYTVLGSVPAIAAEAAARGL